MWHRNKTKVLKKTEVLIGKLAKCFLEFMVCICEILGRLSEDVYSKEDEYILVKTKHPGRTVDGRKQSLDLNTLKKVTSLAVKEMNLSNTKRDYTLVLWVSSWKKRSLRFLSGDSHPLQVPCFYIERLRSALSVRTLTVQKQINKLVFPGVEPAFNFYLLFMRVSFYVSALKR